MKEEPDLSPERDLVSIGNYPNSLVAETVRSCLEMDGIEAFVFDGEISNMNGLYTTAFGGVKVMVASSDRDKAEAILGEGELATPETAVALQDEIEPDGIHCEKCHSKRVRTRASWNLRGGAARSACSRLFGRTRVTMCRDCGFSVRT
jgi:hypothetical protein